MDQELHVVFGAGQVGTALAARLLALGKRVRVVRRTDGSVAQGAEAMRGDAAGTTFCAQAAAGAAVVYHCMNPPYDASAWAAAVPRYLENLITAAGKAGARLVVLDNLYMLGRTHGRPMNEDTPLGPCSRKGEIRARAAERLLDAHRQGEVRAVWGRASDFYGPHGTLTYVGDHFWKPALTGRVAWSPVDLDAIHTYHFIPDVAAALALLGAADDDILGQTWMLPCRPPETLRDLIKRLSRSLGREIRLGIIPKWVLQVLGIVSPLVREVNEMSYQWDEPLVVDDRRFRARFAMEPTGAEEAARQTVAWAREHYGVRG